MNREPFQKGSGLVRKRAIIVKFGQIGDVIMAVPAAYALYQQGFELDWVCGEAVRPLLECYSWIKVLPVDDRAIFSGNPFQRIRGICGFWGAVMGRRYDLCATLYYDRRFRLLTMPIRAKRKLSLSRESRSSALLPGRRQTDEFIRLLLSREDSCVERSTLLIRPDRLPSSPWTSKRVKERIAVVPGGTRNVVGEQPLRRWPIENYLQITHRLLDRGWEVVLIGGPDDTWVSEKFQALPVTDCIGRLSLPQVISAFDDCDAVISHDTGPMHLAGLTQVCLIGIFGPTDPSVFLPRRTFSLGIWGGQGFACRPCYDGRNFAPCRFNGCMHQVTPELVLRELDQLLCDRNRGLPAPWRIVFPEPALDANMVSINAVRPVQ
ncbi:MAG TPA: glycosyltransferase family 9 protein [Terracidiphilus sp.]|jgi:heptosyltransferase-2